MSGCQRLLKILHIASRCRTFDLYTRTNQLLVDGTIFAFSFAAAYLIRFEGLLFGFNAHQFWLWAPFLVAARLLLYWTFGVYRFIWRFVCLSDATAIGSCTFAVTSILLAIRLAYPSGLILSRWVRLPLSIIALEFFLSLSACLGARILRRMLYERSRRLVMVPGPECKRVILYGAGRAGILLSRELENHPDVSVVGFIDDDQKKLGTVISGVKVLGNGKSLAKIVRHYPVDEVFVSIISASPAALTQIRSNCARVPVAAKIMPTLQEIVKGRANISHVREIRPEDLLDREAVQLGHFDHEVRCTYAGKRILVTGAGGSIGSEIVRQLVVLEPSRIVVLDKDENSIYELERELQFRFPAALIEPRIADVQQAKRMMALFAELKPQVVFHAAAHKHVPLMERNPCEAVLNNIYGTQNLLEAASEHQVERFVFISSDKAVNPSNVMGATKRAGERLVQICAKDGRLSAACVRFGNVMGSRGSVIPLFKSQIAQGGPITVTHPDVVRFFMTIPEAVQLVLCAGSLAGQGTVFVLNMGNPRNILDLAHQMITLSGLEPVKDIRIEIIGLRPGEKMNEELVGSEESLCPTRFDKISLVCHGTFDDTAFSEKTLRVIKAAEQNNRLAVYEILSAMQIGFSHQQPRARHASAGEMLPV